MEREKGTEMGLWLSSRSVLVILSLIRRAPKFTTFWLGLASSTWKGGEGEGHGYPK